MLTKFSLKRICKLSVFLPIYICLNLINLFFLLLDELLFFSYRKCEIVEPVFVLGIPRSGTTLTLNTLAANTEAFTSVKLWEIIFAPSITQKKIFLLISRLDRVAGGKLKSFVLWCDNKLFGDLKGIHPMSLLASEEDEYILSSYFLSTSLILLFPNSEMVNSLIHFDEELNENKRISIMCLYKKLIQRHMYVFGGQSQRFLSKNPCFTARTKTLEKIFPDAVFIHNLRSPNYTVASMNNLAHHPSSVYANVAMNKTEITKMVKDIVFRWYQYECSVLCKSKTKHIVLPYNCIKNDFVNSMRSLYLHIGKTLDDSEAIRLEKLDQDRQIYKSRSAYSLDDMHYTKQEQTLINEIDNWVDSYTQVEMIYHTKKSI